MTAEESKDWLVGVLAVKLHKSPQEIRGWPMRDAMLVYNSLAFLHELEQREIEKSRKVKRWNTA